MRRVCAAVAFLVALPLLVSAQVPAAGPPAVPPRDAQAAVKSGTARLSGRVVNAETGRPLRRAVVRTSSPELREGRSVSTDNEGRWEIADLPAGRYTIFVSKGGYVTLQYGQRRPFEQGKPVELADGRHVDKLDVSLPKGSVITGRIVDEFGEPISGARVSAMRHRFIQGQRRLMVAGGGGPISGVADMTDDLGQYRLHGLSPGDYFVSATLSTGFSVDVSSDRSGYTATYYPGTASANEAQRVSVAQGQETADVSFALTPTRVVRISGTVTNSAGKAVTSGMMVLTTSAPTGIGGSPVAGNAMVRPDGTFTFSNVAPGEYRIEMLSMGDMESAMSSGNPPAVAEAASLPITVAGQDLTGIALVTEPTATAKGRVVFDGGLPAGISPAGLMVLMMSDIPFGMPFSGPARVRDDWTFEARGLAGRRNVRVSGMPAGWYLKTVTLNDQDVTDSIIEFKSGENVAGLEVTLTQRAAEITGSVQGERDAAVNDYVAVAFSSDSRKWGANTRHVRTARPDLSGKFVIKPLPPDDYLIVALEYLEPGEEGDPELLERLRRMATQITVDDGESKTVRLKIARER